MDTHLQDLRYAARTLVRAPGFAIVAVLTLALGIGATTAIFSAIHATLLRPLPYADPQELAFLRITIREPDAATVDTLNSWSYPKFELLRAHASSRFSGFAGFARENLSMTGTGAPERLVTELVSASYFGVLGVAPAPGRAFAPEEGAARGAEAVAVISHALWHRRFAGDAGVIGRTIELNQRPFEVIGVAPRGFEGLSDNVDVWVPLTMSTALLWPGALEEPFSHWFQVVARVAPAVRHEEARAVVHAAGLRIHEAIPPPFGNAEFGATLVPLQSERVDTRLRASLLVLFAAVGFVLLIACANVANLLLVRGAARARELAVRRSLGATRRHLARQLLTESVLLAFAGGAAGVLLALWSVDLLGRLGPQVGAGGGGGLEGLYGLGTIRVDSAVLGFAAAVSLIAGLLFGVIPALGATGQDLVSTLKSGAAATRKPISIRRPGWHAGLVVAEVALATVLLAGAGLMLRSFAALRSLEVGFDAERVLTFQLDLGADEYTRERRIQFYGALIQRLETLPGVTAAGVSSCAPLSNGCNRTIVRGTLDRPEIPPEDAVRMGSIGVHYASAGSFRALRVPLLEGRLFETRDRDGAPRVVVINQTAARMLYPGQQAVGKPLGLGVAFTPRGELAEIIGVVGDVKYSAPEIAPIPEAYAPVLQAPSTQPTVFVRTAGDPLALVDAAARVVHELDADLPLFDLATMTDRAADTFARIRFLSILLALFANLALALAAIGLYGVLAYSVAGRAREIGIRVALGAVRGDVIRLVLRDGVGLALIGLTLGTAVALIATRSLGAFLFGVAPRDPRTLALAAAALLGAALLASWLPARRAARTDPIVTLKAE